MSALSDRCRSNPAGRCDPAHGQRHRRLESPTNHGETLRAFFTTKEPGRGDRPGLPTVYGIVQQHAAATSGVYSERGVRDLVEGQPALHRRRVRRVDRVASQVPIIEQRQRATMSSWWSRTRPPFARLAAAIAPPRRLSRAFRSRRAKDGRWTDADQRPTDLVVTDVVMPIMNGRELFEELSRSQPSLSVLFISGYPGDVLSEKGLLEPGIESCKSRWAWTRSCER